MREIRKQVIVTGEKLNSMSEEELDNLLRLIGDQGLSTSVEVKKIQLPRQEEPFPPLPVWDPEMKEKLGALSFNEFRVYLEQQDHRKSFIHQTWNSLVRFSNRQEGGRPVVQEYGVDPEETIQKDYPDLRDQKRLQRYDRERSIRSSEVQERFFIALPQLATALESGELRATGELTRKYLVSLIDSKIESLDSPVSPQK